MALIFGSIIYDLTLILVVIISLLYYLIKRKLNYFKDRGIPYVESQSMLKDIFDTLTGKKSMLGSRPNIYDELEGKDFGGYFHSSMAVIMIRDPQLVEKIMVKDFTKFHDRWFTPDTDKDPLLQNLVNLKGEYWRYLRNKLTPTFTSGKLKGMFEQICNCGENMVKNIDQESKIDKDIDAKNLVKSFALDVIASCAFGMQLKEGDAIREKFYHEIQRFLKPSIIQMIKLMLMLNLPMVPKMLGIKFMPQEMEDFFMNLVSESLKPRKENKIVRNDFLQLMYNLQKSEENGVVVDQIEYDDVIDQMKHAGEEDRDRIPQKKFTDKLIAAQSVVFLLAGSESISGTIGYALFCLTQNPSVQQKLHEEIISVLNSHGSKWSYETVKLMTYLDNVIQESQRMYPNVQALQRICTEPYTMPNGITLETGTKIMIPVSCLHNDPKYYPSPESFDPERFANNNFRPSGKYLPFGNGPRMCIAMRFALLELKVCVARIVADYTVKLSPKTQLPLKQDPKALTLTPVGGFWFEFHKRI